jgi:hypothetical protein
MGLTGKYKICAEDPGDQLWEVSGRMTGVSEDDAGTLEGDWEARPLQRMGGVTPPDGGVIYQHRGLVRFPAHVRGFLESIKVIQESGTATSFTIYVLDRWQEGEYEGNVIYRSDAVVSLASEYATVTPYAYGTPDYGYSYQTFADTTLNVIYAYGLMIPYENRATVLHDAPELYFKIKPNAGADNNFRVKINTVALS